MLIASASAGWSEGDALPDLAALGLKDDLPSVEGKVTYVDFWASWCPPCKAAFPSVERLYQKYGDKGFQVIAISLDANPKAMQRFLDSAKPSFTIARDESNKVATAAGVQYMPTSFLVGPDGMIRAVHVGWSGAESAKQLEKEIQELLGEIEG